MSAGIDITGRFTTLLSGSASAGRAVAAVAAQPGAQLADLRRSISPAPTDPRPADEIVLPYLSGRQSPAPDPTARARIIGGQEGSPGDSSRLLPGILDGVALHAAWALRALDGAAEGDAPGRDAPDQGSGRDRPERGTARDDIVVACGPDARGPALLLGKAAAFGRGVRVPDVDEPVACSAALLAAHRALGAPAHVLPLGPSVRATPSAEAAYAAALDRFIAAASTRAGAGTPERTT
jgi:xylulokinase